ncbi:hypothetical protein NHX12_010903 [Muraenolepis orangiensis]|uniref:Beta-klotho n=1 Tax=Muraenolepis orangiensis TaxID=630683 RepID=A0A9Q0I6N1_9TELE|nr:hypothetical protein NHX12_010903 [Muraenolepis orangiensis]
MLNRLSALPLPCIWLWLVLVVWGPDTVASSHGSGRRLWQQPSGNPSPHAESLLHDTFPPGFFWATGTSAFQTEGAWDRDGKGPSIWDIHTHFTDGGENADVASDSYNRWEDDVEALEYLGVTAYSFSLSWSRLFPDGDARARPNTAAVEHYRRLVERLVERRIKPIVTLFHWDLPQELQRRYGGWKNESMVGLFEEYAAFCFRTFGKEVKHWLTMHNPYLVAVQGYGTGLHAPGEKGEDLSVPLMVAHNLIRAHAKAWHTYHTQFGPTQRGEVSLVLGSHWVIPQRGQATEANLELCQRSMESVLGWFANPIFGDGDYPASMKSQHGDLLPTFTPEEKAWVRKTADFFALSFGPNNLRLSRSLIQYGQNLSPDLRSILHWIQLEYGDLRVLVAEAGWFSEVAVETEDTVAIYLMKRFINQVLQAIKIDGVQVFGYTAWSLVDGFEWNYGYSLRRGLFYIDFSQPNRTRVPKTTAQYYRRVISDNGFPGDQSAQEIRGRFPCDFHWGVSDSTLQFMDPHLYSWNLTGDGGLHVVSEVWVKTREPQCSDYPAIQSHVKLFASTGATHYRFGLNWSLILPQGDLSTVNTEALRYYRCFLTKLREQNLEAVITLYYPTHTAPFLGLPEPLHASGGWLNESTVDAFQDYAALCYRELGSWVQYWITINEPNRLVDVFSNVEQQHQATHHLLLAHAKAWRLYEREHAREQGALVSMALHADWAQPANPFLESHTEAAQRLLLFELGRFLDPILDTAHLERGEQGSFPREVKAYLEQRALVSGLPLSPLPSFSESEQKLIKGTLGFIALNHFTTRLASPYPHAQSAQPNLQQQQRPTHGCLLFSDPNWSSSGLGQALVPWGLREVLGWVKQRYGGALPVIVTASGVDDPALVEDSLRKRYLSSYLQEALKARQLDGVNLQGFYVWKLQDRHAPQFGLFASTQHRSKPKASVAAYRDIIQRGGFPGDNSTQSCRSSESRGSCAVCAQILENKPLLVFGACLLVAVVMLGVVLTMILRLRERSRGERRRRKRGRGVSVCAVPPRVRCGPWQRVPTVQCVTDKLRVVRR